VFSPSTSPDEAALFRQDGNVKFVSASRRADVVPLEISTEFGNANTEAPAPVHALQQAENEQPNLGEANINDIAQKLPQPATTVTVTNYQPLVTSDGPPPTLQAAARSAEPALRAVQPSKKRMQGEQLRGPAANNPVYVPLLNTRASPSDARMSQQKRRQWSPPAATNGSDEIQIHIGRIEVTAVPPPAATIKPKRGAKGPSLQEYLGRRERRTS
jgi:hypothetical protein